MYSADLTLLRIAGDLVVHPPIAAAAYRCVAAKRKKIACTMPLLESGLRGVHNATTMQDEPPSPCTGVCLIDASAGWCSGCRRTIDEIAAWPSASQAFKREVLARLDKRACTLSPGGE
jgi:predicted Fe-S protein YdhL (DUF1289 family)